MGFCESRPLWARELKPAGVVQENGAIKSRPLWARELKPQDANQPTTYDSVAPLVGA